MEMGTEWSTLNHHGDGGRVEHTQSPWRWGQSGVHSITMEMGQTGWMHTISAQLNSRYVHMQINARIREERQCDKYINKLENISHREIDACQNKLILNLM